MTDVKEKITIDIVKGFISENIKLCYIDREDSLKVMYESIAECMMENSVDSFYEKFDERFDLNYEESMDYEVEYVKDKMIEKGFEADDVYEAFEDPDLLDDVRDIIYSRDKSDLFMDLAGNTDDMPVAIELVSNGDCINSHYFEGSYTYDAKGYFTDMVDILNLNPRRVKMSFVKHRIQVYGKWPNLKARDGKELVDYDKFSEEIENSSSPANILTFLTRINIVDLINNDFDVREIIIPKGNYVGLFSSMSGGGSCMDMELLYDFKVSVKDKGDYPYLRLVPDVAGRFGYSSDEVYGCGGSLSGKKLSITEGGKTNKNKKK